MGVRRGWNENEYEVLIRGVVRDAKVERNGD